MEKLHRAIAVALAAAPFVASAQQSADGPSAVDRADRSNVAARNDSGAGRDDAGRSAAANRNGSRADSDWLAWRDMRERLVGVEEILAGDVSNGLNPVGQVTDLVLTADGDQVEYVLFETPYPYTLFSAEDGFASFERIDLERGAALDFDVVLDDDMAAQAPDELRLTADEAEERLVSNLLGARLAFPNDLERIVEDILIDRHTGEITHWVVEMQPDTLFRTEPRTIPAAEVMIDDGGISTSMAYADVEASQELDPNLL